MKKRHYYAAQHPRGFANEIDIHMFDTQAARDEYVGRNDVFPDQRGNRQAWAVTAKEAAKLCRYREHYRHHDRPQH